MSDTFIAELGLPQPDHHLGIGAGSRVAQIAAIMKRLEPVLVAQRPDAVVVIGDVSSTVAAALGAAQSGIPLAHVEAGVRSFDRSMPEEINRMVTDAVAALLLAPTAGARANLAREGAPADRVRLVGNVLVDALLAIAPAARSERAWARLGLAEGRYALVTAHRPANVDDRESWGCLLAVLREVAARLPVLFPVHPRTARRLGELGLHDEVAAIPGLVMTAPLGYADFVSLESGAAAVITDSGGAQVETTVLGVPCLTLRSTTEWPVTVAQGTNRLVGTDAACVAAALESVLNGPPARAAMIDLWDGRAAGRIVDELVDGSWVATRGTGGRPSAGDGGGGVP